MSQYETRQVGKYFRRFEEIECPPDEFSSICVGQFDSAVLMKSSCPPNHIGSSPHRHASNQYLFVAKGTLVVVIAGQEFPVGPSELIFIPAGYPHRNYNPTDEPEFHLEIISPNTTQMARRTEMTDEKTPEGLDIVRGLDPDGYEPTKTAGHTRQWLLNRASGGDFAAISMDRLAPGAGDEVHHIHPFDEFYFVTEGALDVDLAGELRRAIPHTLVCVPAGVAHRIANNDTAEEAHVCLVIPEPAPEVPAETRVDFALTND